MQFPALLIETISADNVIANTSKLEHMLYGATSIQEIVERIDSVLTYASSTQTGLLTAKDKMLLDWLGLNASEKIHVYNNEEESGSAPITDIVIATSDGMTLHRNLPNQVRVGIKPHFDSLQTEGGKVSATHSDKTIHFGNTSTSEVVVDNGTVFVDSSKTLHQSLVYALVFGVQNR